MKCPLCEHGKLIEHNKGTEFICNLCESVIKVVEGNWQIEYVKCIAELEAERSEYKNAIAEIGKYCATKLYETSLKEVKETP